MSVSVLSSLCDASYIHRSLEELHIYFPRTSKRKMCENTVIYQRNVPVKMDDSATLKGEEALEFTLFYLLGTKPEFDIDGIPLSSNTTISSCFLEYF